MILPDAPRDLPPVLGESTGCRSYVLLPLMLAYRMTSTSSCVETYDAHCKYITSHSPCRMWTIYAEWSTTFSLVYNPSNTFFQIHSFKYILSNTFFQIHSFKCIPSYTFFKCIPSRIGHGRRVSRTERPGNLPSRRIATTRIIPPNRN